MKVSSVRYMRRWNMGNYEHTELAIETIPDEGQTAEDLLAATREFVELQRPGSQGAPVSNGKPASAAPPLAKQPAPAAAPPLTETLEKSIETTTALPKRGGRPSKAFKEVAAMVEHIQAATTMDEFLDRCRTYCSKSEVLTPQERTNVVAQLRVKYAALDKTSATQELINKVVGVMQQEKAAIDAALAA